MAAEVTVATLPARHRYVEGAVPPGVRHVGRDRAAGWEPDPAWTDPRLLAPADVVHVHFGFDHLSPGELERWCDGLSQPLVVTVHDLRNPHHGDPEPHRRALQVLLRRADAVLTLTGGAARTVASEYGRSAAVVPHGAIYDGPAAVTEPGLVGIALKSLRRNVVEPARLVAVVAAAVARAGGRLEVTAHREVAGHADLRAIATALRSLPSASLLLHDYLDEHQHRAALSRLQVSVLPNRWGTHSGWLEACRDVGTRVVAPDCGHYAEQWADIDGFRHDERSGLDAASLAAAVARALGRGPVDPVGRPVRAVQRLASHRAHRSAYRDVLRVAA